MAGSKKKLFGCRVLILFLSLALINSSDYAFISGGNQEALADSSQSGGSVNAGPHPIDPTAQTEPYYDDVLKQWDKEGIPQGSQELHVSATGYARKSDDAELKAGTYHGEDSALIWTVPKGWVEYDIDVDREGLYEIDARYFPLLKEDGGDLRSPILSVQLNGDYPFREAHSLSFEREFKEQPAKFGDDGNQFRSLIDEITDWNTKPFRDSEGAYALPLLWHLRKGRNVVRIELSEQPIAIQSFSIKPSATIPFYDEAKNVYPGKSASNKDSIIIEAEQFSSKNSASIQTQYDRDAFTTPSSFKNRIYNTLGGWGWYKGGHAVSWNFEVPEDGLYKIGMRVDQNFRKNLSVFRTIYIDGKIPFKEMESYQIPYASGWHGLTLEDSVGNPYALYLTKGKHTITMEAGYERYMPVITQVDHTLTLLKEVSDEIKSATGNSQDDQYRVWDIEKDIPGVMEQLKELRDQLTAMAGKLIAINKDVDNVAQAYKSSAKDIDELLKKPEKIPTSHLTLGTIQEQLQEQYRNLMDGPLQLDKIYIAPVDAPFPRMKADFFEKVKGMFSTLRYSFVDRNQLGKQRDDELNVWMLMGRDYVDELQQLADEQFTPKYGIRVKVNLIQQSNLLILAKAAGILPDVALGIPADMPYDLALRGVAQNIKNLSGADQLIAKYDPGAILPYYFDGGYYAIPETTGFKVLFYRKDILSELGLKVPDTWDDVYKLIPTLLQHQYNLYVPPDDFSPMFFQNGAEIYSPNGLETALNQLQAFEAFQKWTDLFNIHGMERQVQSFYNQFRAGTMPIGVSDFNMFMQLTVAAPDILNEWAIAPVPGTRKPDGSVVRWAAETNSTSAMLFHDSPKAKQDLAWKFLQWYVSEDTQTQFGLDMEQLHGESFRWNSANIRAFANMPWKKDDLKVLLEQWKWIKDIPNVPGGYMSARELNFAWNRAVVPDSEALESPRISLEQGIRNITRELVRKQQEFHYRDANGNVIKTMDIPQIEEPWKGADIDVN